MSPRHAEAPRCQDVEFRHAPAQRIDEHDPPARQKLVRPLDDARRLLLDRLDPGRAHARPRDGLRDRSRIGVVVLLPGHIGLHIGGRDQARFMPQRRDLAAR
jgi:hypothetical protein